MTNDKLQLHRSDAAGSCGKAETRRGQRLYAPAVYSKYTFACDDGATYVSADLPIYPYKPMWNYRRHYIWLAFILL